MGKQTVLVTACGCPGGPSVVRAVAEGFRVVATDMSPEASGRYYADAFYTVPGGGEPGFVDALLDVCRREDVAALLPESSGEVLALAESRARFEALGVTVLVSPPEAVALALDKAKTYKALEGSGVPLPHYRLVRGSDQAYADLEAIQAAMYDIGWPSAPVVLKRPGGKGGRGFWIVQPGAFNRMELDMRAWPNSQRISAWALTQWAASQADAGRGLGRWLVMEYLQGDESSADTFDGFGSLGFTKIRRACRLGLHFHHEARYDPELMTMGRQVVQALGLEYFVNVQFMAGKLMEVNPRISTMIYHDRFNMPLLGLQLALGLVDRVTVTLPDGVRAQYYHDLRSYGGPGMAGGDNAQDGNDCAGNADCDCLPVAPLPVGGR